MWVMILVVLYGDVPSVTSVPFSDEAACNAAGRALMQRAQTIAKVIWECSPTSSK